MKLGKTLIASFLVMTVAIAGYYKYRPSPEEHLHYHAGFIVYIDGVKQDYSDYKYMNLEPCSEHSEKKSAKEEQIEKAHLHDGVGDVVHVHRPGAKWGDLFKNIGVKLPTDTLEVLYINGELAGDMYNQPIKAYDTATFVFGSDRNPHKDERVSVEHIKDVEAKSELCGTGE